jgi:hypothetical protein
MRLPCHCLLSGYRTRLFIGRSPRDAAAIEVPYRAWPSRELLGKGWRRMPRHHARFGPDFAVCLSARSATARTVAAYQRLPPWPFGTPSAFNDSAIGRRLRPRLRSRTIRRTTASSTDGGLPSTIPFSRLTASASRVRCEIQPPLELRKRRQHVRHRLTRRRRRLRREGLRRRARASPPRFLRRSVARGDDALRGGLLEAQADSGVLGHRIGVRRLVLVAPRGYCAGVERAVEPVEVALGRWVKGSEIVSCASAASRQFGSASSVNAVVRKRWVQSSAWRRVSAKTIGMPG